MSASSSPAAPNLPLGRFGAWLNPRYDDETRVRFDRLLDALVLHGTLDEIVAGLNAQLDAGADHVAIQVLGPDVDNPITGYRQLAEVLW